jgi:RNA methyltransferase, TrmH family
MGHDRIVRFRTARRDPELTVVEGFHALKHALRFGAEVVEAVAIDPASLEEMAKELAPDLRGRLDGVVEPVDAEELAAMVPLVPHTGVVAIARRPPVDLATTLADPRPAPVVLLEDPSNMGNIGACIRVAAAADAAAVLTTGDTDPWFPDAVRGAAGLHYALPVAAVDELPLSDRPLLAIDPDGEDLHPAELPPRAVLGRADGRIAIPMREGVSSLNLATSVAVTLFAWRLAAG